MLLRSFVGVALSMQACDAQPFRGRRPQKKDLHQFHGYR
jgi:hypothetical protein